MHAGNPMQYHGTISLAITSKVVENVFHGVAGIEELQAGVTLLLQIFTCSVLHTMLVQLFELNKNLYSEDSRSE